MFIWCKKCSKQKTEKSLEVVKIEKEKKGLYYPYRDSMDSEIYFYTEVTLRCDCGELLISKEDTNYTMEESCFEKYGKHSHFGT